MDEAEVIQSDPLTSFHSEIKQASEKAVKGWKHWAEKLSTLATQLENTGKKATALATEHYTLGETIAHENFDLYRLAGPSLGTAVMVEDKELVEKLLRARYAELQDEIAKKLALFDDWEEVFNMFIKHFREDVETRFGENGAKDLS